MAFDSIDPFGEQREDLRAGIVAAAVANYGMSRPKTPARPLDFMPYAKARGTASGPILLRDPVQQGKLIAESLFGKMMKAGK